MVNHKFGMMGKRRSWSNVGTKPVRKDRRKLRNVSVVTVWTKLVILWSKLGTPHIRGCSCVGMRPLEQSTVCILFCDGV